MEEKEQSERDAERKREREIQIAQCIKCNSYNYFAPMKRFDVYVSEYIEHCEFCVSRLNVMDGLFSWPSNCIHSNAQPNRQLIVWFVLSLSLSLASWFALFSCSLIPFWFCTYCLLLIEYRNSTRNYGIAATKYSTRSSTVWCWSVSNGQWRRRWRWRWRRW